MARMERLLERLGIQDDQRRPIALLSAYFFIAIAGTTVIKSVEYELFLGKARASGLLPALYITSALFSVPVIVWFKRLASRRSSLRLAAVTVGALGLTLIGWIPLVANGTATVYFAMCVWGSVFSLLLPSVGWIVSYDIFTVRESKRAFGLLGTAAILGGAAGGYVMLFLARKLSPITFLIGVAIALAGLELILAGFHTSRGKKRGSPLDQVPQEDHSPPEGRLGFFSIFSSPYSRYLGLLVLVSAASMTLVDLQYKLSLERRFSDSPGAIAQFLGGVQGNVFLASAALQLFATHAALRRLGVALTALVAPLVLFSGSAIWTLVPGFWPVVALIIVQETLKPSLHRTSLEVFYTPVPSGQRAAFRGLVELLGVRSGDGLAALLFLAAAAVWPKSGMIGAVMVCLLALLWLWTAWRTGREYPTTLRLGLQLGLGHRKTGARPSEEILTAALRSSDPRKARLALEELANTPAKTRELPAFSLAAEEPLHLSVVSSESGWLPLARGFLEHPDSAVRAAALKALVRHDPVTYNRVLKKQLSSDLLPDRAFLLYVAGHAARPERLIEPGQMLRWCQAVGPREKAAIARIMGKTRNSAYAPVLRQWLHDPDSEVAGAAIEALGQYRDERFFDMLAAFLKTPKRREAARTALASYGDEAVKRFGDAAGIFTTSRRLKRETPRILARINSSASRAALAGLLWDPDPQVSYEALKALNRTHSLMELSAAPDLFAPLLDSWARDCYFFQWLAVQAGEGDGSDVSRLLRRLCEERSAQAREKLFRTLDLVFPQGDAFLSLRALETRERALEHKALELMEARMSPEQRRKLLPALTTGLTETEIREAAAIFALPSDLAGCLRTLLDGDDVVARCVALAFIKRAALNQLTPAAVACLKDPDPLVRETAEKHWGAA